LWDEAERLIEHIKNRGPRKVFYVGKSKDGRYYGRGRISAPKKFIGKKVYIVTEEELQELSRLLVRLNALKDFFVAFLNSEKCPKMFNIVGETWNPVTGCIHNCNYCWARKLALSKLRNSRRYRNGFIPRLNPEEFRKSFKGGIVFVSDMGDLFNVHVKDEWIMRVIRHIRKFPDTFFLFLTKNPARYQEFIGHFPRNVILGTTIETDDDDLYLKHRISSAPIPSRRYKAMKELNWPCKFVSIEPILDFNLDNFVKWIRDIAPFMVYVGYDNYNNKLPEPSLKKTMALIEKLSRFTLVVRKTIRPAWFESMESYIDFSKSAKNSNEAGVKQNVRENKKREV